MKISGILYICLKKIVYLCHAILQQNIIPIFMETIDKVYNKLVDHLKLTGYNFRIDDYIFLHSCLFEIHNSSFDAGVTTTLKHVFDHES